MYIYTLTRTQAHISIHAHTHTHTHTHTNMHVYAYANMPPPANKQWGVWSTRSLTSKLINLLKNIFSTKLEYFYTDPPLDSCPSLLLFSPSYTLLLTFFSSPLTSIILLSYYFLLLLSCYPSIHPIFLLIHFLLSSLQWLGVRLDSIYRLGCPFLRSEARRYSWIESISWSQTEGNQSCRSSSDPFFIKFLYFPNLFYFCLSNLLYAPSSFVILLYFISYLLLSCLPHSWWPSWKNPLPSTTWMRYVLYDKARYQFIPYYIVQNTSVQYRTFTISLCHDVTTLYFHEITLKMKLRISVCVFIFNRSWILRMESW